MCNLYSMTKGPAAVREFLDTFTNLAGNMPPQPGVFPDYLAPILRNNGGQRELAMARWGMPSPAFALKGRSSDPGITNVRNTSSPHWKRWLSIEHRCVVPFTSFSEPELSLTAVGRPSGSLCLTIGRWPFCRHMGGWLEVSPQSQRRRDNERSVCLLDVRSKCRSGCHSPKGNAGSSADGS